MCNIFISYVKTTGLNCFPAVYWECGRFGHVYTRQGKLPGILPHTHTHTHTHTQNPNVADVTIELFAKSCMQWQTNSRGFRRNTNVPRPTAIHYS